MVKCDPNILRTRLVVLFWLCAAIVYVVYFPFYTQPLYGNPFLTFLIFAFMGTVTVLSALSVERFWHKQEQRRERAVQGDTHLLAAEQPPIDDVVLVLPLMITQRIPKRWNVVLIVGIALLLTVIIPLFVFTIVFQSKSLADVTFALLLFIFIIGIVFLFLAVPFLQCYQKLVVDEQGIHVRVGLGRVHFVRWDEARLFAVSSTYQRNRTFSGQIAAPFYEIASVKDVARWQWLHDNSKVLFNISEPTIPFTEYDKQMQALLSLIAAKTHLVLYDVRPETQE